MFLGRHYQIIYYFNGSAFRETLLSATPHELLLISSRMMKGTGKKLGAASLGSRSADAPESGPGNE